MYKRQAYPIAASAAMGYAPGSPEGLADVGMCYRPSGGGEAVNFLGSFFIMEGFSGLRLPYSATATVVLPPGSYLVGMCVRNNSSRAITNNNYVNGYAQVTR